MAQSSKRTPGFGHWFLHIRKTIRLIGTLLRDPQVAGIRKFFFVATIVLFAGVLFIPDSLVVVALAAVLPLASPILGIPVGLIDIAALSAVMYGLLRFFPREIVAQHAEALYGPHPDIVPHTHIKNEGE